jgi:hypothetical protein
MLADTAITHPPVDIERVMTMDDRATELGMVKVKTKCGVRLENDILSIGNVTICHIGEGDQRVAGEVTRWYRQTLHSYLIYGLAQPFRHTLDTSKNDMFELAAYTAQTSPQYYEMLKWCVQLAMLKRRDELGIPIPPEAGPVDEDFGSVMKPIRPRDIKFFNDLHWSGPPAGVCEMTLEWWEQRAKGTGILRPSVLPTPYGPSTAGAPPAPTPSSTAAAGPAQPSTADPAPTSTAMPSADPTPSSTGAQGPAGTLSRGPSGPLPGLPFLPTDLPVFDVPEAQTQPQGTARGLARGRARSQRTGGADAPRPAVSAVEEARARAADAAEARIAAQQQSAQQTEAAGEEGQAAARPSTSETRSHPLDDIMAELAEEYGIESNGTDE